MNPLLIALAAGLAIITVWGFVSPRGQWRVLAGWSRRDPYGSEPGPVAVTVYRIVAGAAIVGLAIGTWSLYVANQPDPLRPVGKVSGLSVLWGLPAPVVVNRTIAPLDTPPSGLMAVPLLRYQAVTGAERDPGYLFSYRHYPTITDPGFVGEQPPAGLTALDTANLVVQVRGDKECFPSQVVVVELTTAVRVGVYYAHPGGPDGGTCRSNPTAAQSISTLIPIPLSSGGLNHRPVTALDGSPIAEVRSRS